MKRVISVIVFLLVWTAVPGWAQEDPFNVDCFLGWGGYYRPGEWTPLEISIDSTLTEPFAGTIHVSVAQDNINQMHIAQGFVLTPGLKVHIPLVTKIAFGADRLTLRLTDNKGSTRWSGEIQLWDFSQTNNQILQPANRADLLVGLVGRQGRFGLLRLPNASICHFQEQSNRYQGQVRVQPKLVHMLPWDWTGFVGLDLLVLYDPDWSQFRDEQIQAVTDWVTNGGKLLVVLGRYPFPANTVLSRRLPVTFGAWEEITLDEAWLTRWGLSAERAEQANGYRLSPRPGTRVYTSIHKDEPAVFCGGQLGFGRVAVLGVDPGTLSEAQRSHANDFWVHAFNSLLEDIVSGTTSGRDRPQSQTTDFLPVTGHGAQEYRTIELQASNEEQENNNYAQHSYNMGLSQQGTNRVLDYLVGIEQMRPLSIGWVVLLLVLLAVLLGPVDYIVLKRLDRQPLTWLTSIFWITVFTVGAYYGVQALRAGDMQLRTVSVIDAVQDTDTVWATRIMGLFAPKSADYQLDRLDTKQWWSAVAATRGYVNAFQAHSSRHVYYRQSDGGNLPFSMPVNIWTMQTMLMESPRQTVALEARVQAHGDGSVTTEIANHADCAVEQGILLWKTGQGLWLGRVEPGQTRTMKGQLKPIDSWQVIHPTSTTRSDRSLDSVDVFDLIGTRRRSQGFEDYLRQGAAVVCVQFEQAPTPVTVKNKTCKYQHVQFARLVVFPQ